MSMKNAVATAGINVVKRFGEARLLLWESQHWTKKSEARSRREAKRGSTRALRRSARAHIADSNVGEV